MEVFAGLVCNSQLPDPSDMECASLDSLVAPTASEEVMHVCMCLSLSSGIQYQSKFTADIKFGVSRWRRNPKFDTPYLKYSA